LLARLLKEIICSGHIFFIYIKQTFQSECLVLITVCVKENIGTWFIYAKLTKD